ncbi:MAG: hypothetical protein B6D37_14250 [Sphingobacteriales bacterium UTBCD1]|nr:MAG: hypothetical protein B6D37_14250 [Sphingobacteriales bacterium UTBCD1]
MKFIYNYKIFIELFGIKSANPLNLFYNTDKTSGKFFKIIQNCGVMKPFGRHALLSRGWGSQDKQKVEPAFRLCREADRG